MPGPSSGCCTCTPDAQHPLAGAEDAAAVDEVYRQIDHYLVVERNRAWLAKILDHAEEAVEMVVAVGAAHLPGVDGLVNL